MHHHIIHRVLASLQTQPLNPNFNTHHLLTNLLNDLLRPLSTPVNVPQHALHQVKVNPTCVHVTKQHGTWDSTCTCACKHVYV